MSIPERPTLDGLEAKWDAVWAEQGTYAFDRTAERADVFSVDTPPPTVSGSLHMGSVFGYAQTDSVARYRRMTGKTLFYPMGWDDNGLPTERRVQNFYGVRCDPAMPYDPAFTPPDSPAKEPLSISRRNFVELCLRLTVEDEKVFEQLWRTLGLSVDWAQTYTTIGPESQRASQRAFLRNLARGEAYAQEAPTLWDVDFRTAVAQAELEDREQPGAYHRIGFARADGEPVFIETTRPELLPACVALVAHPDDARYQPLFGTTVTTPLFGVEVPVHAHPLADPEKGSGIAMICTFGDTTDVVWWRELDLPVRSVVGRDGRLLPTAPEGVAPGPYAELAGKNVKQAQRRVVELLAASGDLVGEPRPITHPVKFFEKGDRPLEVVTSRQWYVRNGGRDETRRAELLQRGKELVWHPAHMQARYDNWVGGLNGDWLISRQRFFGVPIPLWYRLDEAGEPVYADPLVPDEASLPVDPSSDLPPGFDEDQRGVPGGFTGDPDVMDTWATSSLTPQIAGALGGRPRPVRPGLPDGPAAPGTGDHPYLAVRDRRALPPRARRAALARHDHQRLGARPRPQEDEQVPRQRRDADAPAGAVRRRRRALLGVQRPARHRHRRRPGPDEERPPARGQAAQRQPLRARLPGRRRGPVTEPLDRALLARLAEVVAEATAAFEAYDYARALERTEAFFWTFCDDYIELVKGRAYGEGQQARSASRALRLALDALLRLFAPVLPFATEEVWSWWREGSVHRQPWPAAGALRAAGAGDDTDLLPLAAEVLAEVRRAKSTAKLSMRAGVERVLVVRPEAELALLRGAETDLRNAGVVAELAYETGEPARTEVVLAPVPDAG